MKTTYCYGLMGVLFIAALVLSASVARATPARFVQNNLNSRGLSSLSGPEGSIKIRGQTRGLSMMLVLKNGKDEINFIKPRKDYHTKVLSTQF